jgi:rhodanese-related sulfurtransferase
VPVCTITNSPENYPVDRKRARRTIALMQHAPGFLKLVDDAKTRIHEITINDARQRLAANPAAVLLDVREDAEWAAGHAREAQHLGKGILERDIEQRFPEKDTEIIMYCGGGYRSALTCDAAQKIGYTNVRSLIGGYKGMVAAGWEMVK